MTRTLRGKVAIAGIGSFNVGSVPGFSAMENLGGAALRAISDAGLNIQDIDAVFSASSAHAFPTLSVCEYLGLKPTFVGGANVGGSSFEMHVIEAALALEAGLCNAALICYGSNQRSAGGRLVSMAEKQWQEEPYRFRMPINGYAMAAARHMYEYGTTREMLAEVAVAARAWANLNPEAYARGPLSLDDVLSARLVSDPLSVLDCCLVTDGGGAIVMVRSDRAKDLKQPPVYFLGGGMAQWHRSISEMPNLTVTAATESGPRAFEMAGVSQTDVDLLMLYDAFTINTILFLEDLGFCPKGEGGRFVQDGALAPGGRLAVNTNGGGLSCMHPGMYGLFLIIEAVRQLRGDAGERQLKEPEIALCHGNGGVLSSQVSTLFGTASTL
ncbi:thiolase [Pusillimonas sp. ANT_WB101]|uniref:thiolase n=1 Tax=Pusillimonas sp. ANT_WB101 TaxID=2597356 RepID=UPI0011EF8AC9|nr:thiolase [Pusillimonas sp. ANT_WB101]KAA0890840.1 thiolase [Pusillimonas sp. ANT_WB101]